MTTSQIGADVMTESRVWIACLACYNDGRLVGDWFPASIADDVTLDEVHAEFGGQRTGCEEMWVFDHEGLPIVGECSPFDAAELARLLESVEEGQRDAFGAWIRGGCGREVSEFEDAYAGEWGAFREYADECADEQLACYPDAPEFLSRYFDYDAFARDLRFDYWTDDAPSGRVYVFRAV